MDLQDDGEKQRKTLTKFMKGPASDQNLRPMTMEIHLGSGTNYNHLNLPSKIKQVWMKHWMHNEPTYLWNNMRRSCKATRSSPLIANTADCGLANTGALQAASSEKLLGAE